MRGNLKDWVRDAVEQNGGEASIVETAKHIWKNHRNDLEMAGDLFFTWQYEMRWAAQQLRDENVLALGPNRKWVLAARA